MNCYTFCLGYWICEKHTKHPESVAPTLNQAGRVQNYVIILMTDGLRIAPNCNPEVGNPYQKPTPHLLFVI